jgi:hypothetical protein
MSNPRKIKVGDILLALLDERPMLIKVISVDNTYPHLGPYKKYIEYSFVTNQELYPYPIKWYNYHDHYIHQDNMTELERILWQIP